MTTADPTEAQPEADTLVLRPPVLADGAAMHALVKRCPPLDVNTEYCYFLLASHFAATSCVAELEGVDGLAGLVTGYRLPEAPDTLFVWQVAVDGAARGRSLARRLIEHIVLRDGNEGLRWVHTTVSPSNEPSRRLFASVARSLGGEVHEAPFIQEQHFAAGGHEAEPLLRVGPFRG